MTELSLTLERMRAALGVKNDHQLTQALGISSGAISTWKKRGNIPEGNLAKVSKLSGKPVSWFVITIDTSANSSDKIKTKSWPVLSSDPVIQALGEWLEEISKDDPGRRDWFRIEMMDKFPGFKEFMKRKDQTGTEVDLGQQHKRIA